MATWPSTLQSRLNVRDFTLSSEDTTIRTNMQYGPAKVRSRYTDAIDNVSCSINMDITQYNTLQSFYKTTLGNGVASFDFIHPVTQTLTKVRFVGPPKYTPLGGRVFMAQMVWEFLP